MQYLLRLAVDVTRWQTRMAYLVDSQEYNDTTPVLQKDDAECDSDSTVNDSRQEERDRNCYPRQGSLDAVKL